MRLEFRVVSPAGVRWVYAVAKADRISRVSRWEPVAC